MSKIHIALVGGQATPVYQGIVYTNPDKVYLICSELTYKDAMSIKAQLPSLESNIEVKKISDKDIREMEEATMQLLNEIPAEQAVSLNLSGGLKAWTIVFNNIFSKTRPNAQIFCLGQDGTVFDITSDRSDEKVDFDMDAQFRLLGNEIASYTTFAEYTPEDMAMLKKVKFWGFNGHYHKEFKDLTNEFMSRTKDCEDQPITVTVKNSRLEWNPETKTFDGNLLDKKIHFDCPHAWHILLNTGWFEVYVASLLAQFYPPEDIRLNCVFKTKSDALKNEVDIIVNQGKKLIFVECKTQVYNTTDVDKFASVVRTYGGLGSKALFVTNTMMRDDAQEKCNDKGIATYYTARKDVNTPEERTALMKQMLDTLINSWNAK